MILDCFRSTIVGIQSFIVVDDSEFIDELNVDIAAERTPATTMPLNPTVIIFFIT